MAPSKVFRKRTQSRSLSTFVAGELADITGAFVRGSCGRAGPHPSKNGALAALRVHRRWTQVPLRQLISVTSFGLLVITVLWHKRVLPTAQPERSSRVATLGRAVLPVREFRYDCRKGHG